MDDPDQRKDETPEERANKACLREARKNYQEFGACDAHLLKFVRAPRPEELSGFDN